MVEIGEYSAAAKVHDESSLIAKDIRRIALEEGYDIILDGIANHDLEVRATDTAKLKAHGHTVVIDYVTLDTKLSLQLAEQRFERTGRLVPEDFIRAKNQMISQLIPQLIDNELFDELYLRDTNIENHPRLILSQKNGQLAIENQALYENFKRKADEA